MPESQDASRAAVNEIGDLYEMTYNLFVQPGYKPSGRRAQNVNTIDEVPDSSWFTNRIGARPVSIDEVVRGPVIGDAPDPSRWTIIREKTSGAHPGVTARDAKGQTWFLEATYPANLPEIWRSRWAWWPRSISAPRWASARPRSPPGRASC